jgi:hypothetical protein
VGREELNMIDLDSALRESAQRDSQYVSLRDVMHKLPPDIGARETFRRVFQSHWFRATTKKRFFFLFAYSLASLTVHFALFVNATLLVRHSMGAAASPAGQGACVAVGLGVVVASTALLPGRWIASSLDVKQSLQVAIWLALLSALMCHSTELRHLYSSNFFSLLHVSAFFSSVAYAIVIILPVRVVSRWFESRFKLTALGLALAMQPLGLGLAVHALFRSESNISEQAVLLAAFATLFSIVLFSVEADPVMDPNVGAFVMRGYDAEMAEQGAVPLMTKFMRVPSIAIKCLCMVSVTAATHPFVQMAFVFRLLSAGEGEQDSGLSRDVGQSVDLNSVGWVLCVVVPLSHVVVGAIVDGMQWRKKVGSCVLAAVAVLVLACVWVFVGGTNTPLPEMLLGVKPRQSGFFLCLLGFCQAALSLLLQHIVTEIAFLHVATHEALAIYHCAVHSVLLVMYGALALLDPAHVRSMWNGLLVGTCVLVALNLSVSRIVYVREDLESIYQRFLRDNRDGMDDDDDFEGDGAEGPPSEFSSLLHSRRLDEGHAFTPSASGSNSFYQSLGGWNGGGV